MLAKCGAETISAGVIGGKFTRRQQANLGDLVDGALGIDIEGAHAIDGVIQQIDAVGQHAAHGEQIDESAAYAELARRDHLRDMLIARQHQLRAQRIQAQNFALLQEKRVGGKIFRRRQALQGRGRGQYHHIECTALNLVQRGQPFRHQILVRREAVVGQGFPVREQADLKRGCEPGDFVPQSLRFGGARAKHHKRARLACQFRQRQGVAATMASGRCLGTGGLTG